MVEPAGVPTRPRIALRSRVALTFAGLGLVVSVCVAGVALHFSDSYVDRLSGEMLRAESEYLRGRLQREGAAALAPTHHFLMRGDLPGLAPAPQAWRDLAPGLHEVPTPRGHARVQVFLLGAQRVYVQLDIGDVRAREQHLARDLVLLVLIGTLLSAWLGWIWAGRAIEPVSRLAQAVEQLEPLRRGTQRLAPGFAADEVGRLAHAFDLYQEKLRAYVRRERAFTADASHELRTPLAVIRGALEVMLDGDCAAADAARLRRMQRGCDELRDLLDALLVLARGEDDETFAGNTPDLDALVARLLRDRTDMLHTRHVQITHRGVPGIVIPAPPRVIEVVLGNLLRALVQFAEQGELRVEVDKARVHIAYHEGEPGTDSGAGLARLRESADRALGLGMIRRVCQRWGWRLEEDDATAGQRFFVVHFADQPTAFG